LSKNKPSKFSVFCDIIHPFVLPTRVCVVINCSKLLFYLLAVKTFAYHICRQKTADIIHPSLVWRSRSEGTLRISGWTGDSIYAL